MKINLTTREYFVGGLLGQAKDRSSCVPARITNLTLKTFELRKNIKLDKIG